MCKKCEKLLNVSKDKKSKIILFDESDKAVDASEFVGFMEINHHEDGTPYAFIKQDITIESTGRSYGISVYIQYCPFCGEKLFD